MIASQRTADLLKDEKAVRGSSRRKCRVTEAALLDRPRLWLGPGSSAVQVQFSRFRCYIFDSWLPEDNPSASTV
jgi:hypothetical protein